GTQDGDEATEEDGAVPVALEEPLGAIQVLRFDADVATVAHDESVATGSASQVAEVITHNGADRGSSNDAGNGEVTGSRVHRRGGRTGSAEGIAGLDLRQILS